jgi:predicted DNA-binding transcriptional regulator YafY
MDDQTRVPGDEAEQILAFRYENYRGETAIRRIVPDRIWFGETDWHSDPQWLLDGWDLDRGSLRTFAVGHIQAFLADTGPRVLDRSGTPGAASGVPVRI